MSPEELDEATVEEAKRRWLSTPALRIHGTLGGDVPFIAARLARENWTPPEPVDPDILAFREWLVEQWPDLQEEATSGETDSIIPARAYRAGARMAREQERERAKVLLRGLEDIVDTDQDEISHMAFNALAKYRGEA